MAQLRVEEEWARQLMEAVLGVPVVQHDDGSRPSMHDLDVIHGEGHPAAVEVIGAVDAEATEFWNYVNRQGRWVEGELAGEWFVRAKPNARRLKRDLPPFLRALEQAGVRSLDLRASGVTKPAVVPPPGVVKATQYDTEFPGSIHVLPELPNEQIAAFMPNTGDPLAEWLGAFLRDDERAGDRQKLGRSGAGERHAFVIVSSLSGTPAIVSGLLIANDVALPTIAPDLPPEITEVWAVSPWDSGFGFRWSSATARWQTFSKRPPQP